MNRIIGSAIVKAAQLSPIEIDTGRTDGNCTLDRELTAHRQVKVSLVSAGSSISRTPSKVPSSAQSLFTWITSHYECRKDWDGGPPQYQFPSLSQRLQDHQRRGSIPTTWPLFFLGKAAVTERSCERDSRYRVWAAFGSLNGSGPGSQVPLVSHWNKGRARRTRRSPPCGRTPTTMEVATISGSYPIT